MVGHPGNAGHAQRCLDPAMAWARLIPKALYAGAKTPGKEAGLLPRRGRIRCWRADCMKIAAPIRPGGPPSFPTPPDYRSVVQNKRRHAFSHVARAKWAMWPSNPSLRDFYFQFAETQRRAHRRF